MAPYEDDECSDAAHARAWVLRQTDAPHPG
jgi:hypothetical protein